MLAELVRQIVDDPVVMLLAPPLVRADRCDRCPGQAKVRVLLPSKLILDFCNHHYVIHAAALHLQGAVVAQTSEEGEAA